MNRRTISSYIKGKTLLVTGGTGSFGVYLVKNLLSLKPQRLIVFSRDEWKQYILKQELEQYSSILSFVIGDVRNFQSLLAATRGVDLIYHAAAMKHVPICEQNPIEAVYTNILGAYNLKEAAIRNNVAKVVAVSTDKAVRSVNIMGMTKAIQERILLSDHQTPQTTFVCVRFGNVVGSRGSVVPLFRDQLDRGVPLTITDKRMTRFLIDLESAMELIFTATLEGKGREIFVKKMPVCRIMDLAEAMIEAKTGGKTHPVRFKGIREGEQLYETLVSEEEMRRAKETGDYFVIYPYGSLPPSRVSSTIAEYRTDLAHRFMTKREIALLLKKTGWI